MEHYVETGQVLGKGSENLEGYDFQDKGHFSPGELPSFDKKFFKIPHGTKEDWLFEQFKSRLEEGNGTSDFEAMEFVTNVKDVLGKGKTTRGDE